MRILGLINARGGSKGVPRKNVRPLLGIPLIAHAIRVGLRSSSVNHLLVSTDDHEIATVAREHGADVPFMRPAELATSSALQIDAIRHALSFLEDRGEHFDAVLLLQPTTPFRLTQDIEGAVALMNASGAETVISVADVSGHHPLTCYTGNPEMGLSPMLSANPAGVRRQDFAPVWWRNGAIYLMRRDVIMDRKSLYGSSVLGYVMPPERSINIDVPLDWVIAEAVGGWLVKQGLWHP
jgi:CMP-N-acetylneuraminic acid synthetase